MVCYQLGYPVKFPIASLQNTLKLFSSNPSHMCNKIYAAFSYCMEAHLLVHGPIPSCPILVIRQAVWDWINTVLSDR